MKQEQQREGAGVSVEEGREGFISSSKASILEMVSLKLSSPHFFLRKENWMKFDIRPIILTE